MKEYIPTKNTEYNYDIFDLNGEAISQSTLWVKLDEGFFTLEFCSSSVNLMERDLTNVSAFVHEVRVHLERKELILGCLASERSFYVTRWLAREYFGFIGAFIDGKTYPTKWNIGDNWGPTLKAKGWNSTMVGPSAQLAYRRQLRSS